MTRTPEQLMADYERSNSWSDHIEIDDELYYSYRMKLDKDDPQRKMIERWLRRKAIADKRREAKLMSALSYVLSRPPYRLDPPEHLI